MGVTWLDSEAEALKAAERIAEQARKTARGLLTMDRLREARRLGVSLAEVEMVALEREKR
jgi:hypothetical protein